ncbi:hypothetical protein MML48_2g00006753 [Holotrichia oblita]|uniref:Uncharacterized protein n=1 Tax=Holotrichia oblita TaxID=644536 RepID=A0ACB9TKL6_HOLOL|nr:hypothetical protein MML48_2g00006753 [Holotrichia oblita]
MYKILAELINHEQKEYKPSIMVILGLFDVVFFKVLVLCIHGPIERGRFHECGQSGGEADSDEDVITDYHLPALDMLPRPGPLPTISVTPHSPANKTYPVLEDSLQYVREIHETVQRMRDATVQRTQDFLCQPEAQRRRSWTALEDLTGAKDKIKPNRQRSISLSSMESEADESSLIDNVDGRARLLGTEPVINDFNKIKAKREADQLRQLLPARLPLQKSVSTPSIIAVRDLAPEPALVGAQPTLPIFSDDVPLVPLEFLSDAPLTAADLCSDYSLGLHESEPDSWTPHVGKEIAKKLREKEIKRQEHIYEFILTEKHHCMTLLVMQKAGVVSLQKLLVREKAGQESRGIYLISSNPADPEMFELKVHKPKDKQIWIQAIRAAVQNCPEDEDDSIALSSEEKLLHAKQNQIKDLVVPFYIVIYPRITVYHIEFIGLLRQKDIEQALLLEEKMSLQLRLLAAAGLDPPSPPSYRHLVSENADASQMWKEVLTAVQEVSQLASSLYTTGTNLSRSVSSAGEHQSEAYVSPILPKRAETFGGFDNSNQGPLKLLGKKLSSSSGTPAGTPDLENLKPGDSKLFERLPYRNCAISATPPVLNGNLLSHDQHLTTAPDIPALLSLGREQQYAAIQLSHYVYTLLCIISQLMTTNESLQAQIATMKGGGDSTKYKHNQQLEELRNLQDRLTAEKSAWNTTRDQEAKELEEKKPSW